MTGLSWINPPNCIGRVLLNVFGAIDSTVAKYVAKSKSVAANSTQVAAVAGSAQAAVPTFSSTYAGFAISNVSVNDEPAQPTNSLKNPRPP